MIIKDKNKLRLNAKSKILVLGLILIVLVGLFSPTIKVHAQGAGVCWRLGATRVLSTNTQAFCESTAVQGTWQATGDPAVPPPPNGPPLTGPAPTPGTVVADPCSSVGTGTAGDPAYDACKQEQARIAAIRTAAPDDDTSGLYNNLNKCSFVPTRLNGCFELIMYWIFYELPSFLLGIAANFFNVILALTLSSALYAKATFIGSAWGVVRDLSNIFFILILLYIAVKIILGLGGSEVKKMIAQVIIMALLINFSMFFTKIVIDSSNILALIFYNKINVVSVKTGGGTIDYVPVVSLANAGVQDKDIAGGIMEYFDPTKLLSKDFFDTFRKTEYTVSAKGVLGAAAAGGLIGSAVPIIGTGLGATVGIVGYFFSGLSNDIPTGIIVGLIVISGLILAFAAYAFFIAGLAFLSRLIELWILIIFSPFAFMSSAMPELLGKVPHIGWGEWLKRLLQVSFMAPIFMFFLYFIFLLIKTNIFSSLADRTNPAQQGWMETIILLVIPALVILILLMKATSFAKKWSGQLGEMIMTGAKIAGGLALGAATGGAAFALRGTIGRGAANLAESNRMRDWAARSRFGAGVTRLTNRVAAGTYDARNAPGVGTLAKAGGVNLGTVKSKGFAENRAAAVKRREEFANKQLDTSDYGLAQMTRANMQAGMAPDVALAQAKANRLVVDEQRRTAYANRIQQRSMKKQIMANKIRRNAAQAQQQQNIAQAMAAWAAAGGVPPAGGAPPPAVPPAHPAPCWVAEVLYGVNNPRTHTARLWATTSDNWFTKLYRKHGESWASWLTVHKWAQPIIKPIWNIMAIKGQLLAIKVRSNRFLIDEKFYYLLEKVK